MDNIYRDENYIKIARETDIKVEFDEENKPYTNESIVEFIQNRKANIIPEQLKELGYGNQTDTSIELGNYVTPDGKFNIGAAIAYITQRAYSHYIKGLCGKCAKAVRLALVAGGINTSGNPVAAYKYANFLPTKGFKHIARLGTKEEQASWTSNSAKPGDISVMSHGTYGHICMYNGQQWVSDFKQNGMWVYGGNGTCDIFRYTT